MDSSQLVSWQFENFSTAELSPPTSPVSPSSPLFYDGSSNPASPSGGLKTTPRQSQKAALNTALTSRAQTAANVLSELERLHNYEDQDVFGNGIEESVNLNLFEELADIEYTPPFCNSGNDDDVKVLVVPNPKSPAPTTTALVPVTTNSAKFSAEYQAILESLNTTSSGALPGNLVTSFGDLIQISGIPTTTVVGNECLVPVEFIGRPSSSLGPDESESMDLDGIIISNDMTLIDEKELVGLGLEELSAELIAEESADGTATLVNGEMPYWAKDITIPLDDLDTEMSKNDETLDALLKGDMIAAKSYMSSGYSTPVQQEAFSPASSVASLEDEESIEFIEEEVEEVKPKPAKKKAERRGRKPVEKSLTRIRDKALRKKEQNKTAATRYRQKKKQELVATLGQEDELQAVHDDLEKQKDKLGCEVRMIRGLLRDMLQLRKQRAAPAAPVSASRLTASSIVQAQRVANRRK